MLRPTGYVDGVYLFLDGVTHKDVDVGILWRLGLCAVAHSDGCVLNVGQ